MHFIDHNFPLIVTVSEPIFDAAEVRAMIDGFEKYFTRGERYAVLSASPRKAPAPGPREREMIGQWTNHPRVRDFSKRLCVGVATVVPSAVERAALTVIMAFGKPPCPFESVPTVERGLDYCLERIRAEALPLAKSIDFIRYETLRQVNELVA